MKRLLTIPINLYLVLLVALGTALRFWDIARSSIWHDEGFTMMLAPMSPPQIVARTARDVHPPLYYLLLHYWLLVFGTSETAARSLSALFLVAAIPLAYLLVRRLWTEPAARLAALFVTTGPFLIRYSQEARMYAMVAFLLLLATYLLLRALQTNRWVWWLAYALAIAAALYTHYYAIFMILAHWLYVASRSQRHGRHGLWNPRWWVSNVGAAALFLPWVPTAYQQYTRVQASFWIPPVSIGTVPSTLLEFVTYYLGLGLNNLILVALGAGFLALIGWLYVKHPERRLSLLLLSLYCLLGPVLVWAVSLGKRPIFVDRYFVFAAIGFYCLVGVFVAELRRKYTTVATVVLLGLFGVGILNVHATTDHQMRVIGAYVTTHYQPGDEILSGELYTFFDFSYYNHSGAQVHLWSRNGVNGYSESSLIYDRANQIVVENLATIHPKSGRLWVVGKTGYHQYYDPKIIPSNWVPIGPHITAGYCVVQEYQVLPRPQAQGTVQ